MRRSAAGACTGATPDCFVILFFDGPGGGFGCPNCEEAGEELLDGLTS